MRHYSVLVTALLLLSYSAVSTDNGRPNLAGTWILTSQESRQHLTRSNLVTLTITQLGSEIVCREIVRYADGQTEDTRVFSSDGEERTTPTGFISARWDGDVLIVRQRSSAGDFKESWWLRPVRDGKRMGRVVVVTDSADGKDHLVFRRQEFFRKERPSTLPAP